MCVEVGYDLPAELECSVGHVHGDALIGQRAGQAAAHGRHRLFSLVAHVPVNASNVVAVIVTSGSFRSCVAATPRPE